MTLSGNLELMNKVFDNRVRLGIMSALMVNKAINFNDLKDILQITDGNLASHLKTLEDSLYITVSKGFIGKKTNTTYSITLKGETDFKLHLTALESVIKQFK